MADLNTDVRYIKGIGEQRAKALGKLGIATLRDLISYFPRAYDDRSALRRIADLVPGETAGVAAMVASPPTISHIRKGLDLVKLRAVDDTGTLDVTFFNQAWLKNSLHQGETYIFYGRAEGSLLRHQMANPVVEPEGRREVTGRIVPIYPLTAGISQLLLSRAIRQGLDSCADILPDCLPDGVRQAHQLCRVNYAYENIHFPESAEALDLARRRLAFEELYLIQCGLLLLKKQSQEQRQGIRHRVNGYLVRQLFQALPFQLTNDQQKVWQDICNDMESYVPMRRLLQGDVGSGKTVVAMLALVKTVENGFQGALMAPTEILAHQHYEDFCHLLEPLGVRVALLSGRLSAGKRRGIYEKLAKHEIDIVIGTHALIQDEVQFAALGLAITDEQHRFGINQRALLEQKGDALPDVLVMTATPIPRTLTLTVYGDLDVSMIHQLPPGRKPIRTFVRGEDRRELIYKFVLEEIAKGRQAYVVCPLIESKEESRLSSAQDVYEELSQGIFAGISCGLVHGKLKQKEKEAIMEEFYQGKIKLLVATTVIEVGVNVPNASIMVVEHAQQFGLSQLHQLRGRIGRGEYASYCILVSDGKTENARRRMEIMESTTDGFVLAEEDLKLRGPGQFFGSMQHGLPDLKMADVERDIDILLQARRAALESVDRPEYMSRVLPALRLQYQEQFMNIMEN